MASTSTFGSSAVETVQRSRAARAYQLRVDAATRRRDFDHTAVTTNGDRELFAKYGKGLAHLPSGEVERAAYDSLVHALLDGDPARLEAVPVPGPIRLVDPCASFAYGFEGPDAQALPLPPPPTFASAEQAAEACELYWQSLTRDVAFSDYGHDALIAAACAELTRTTALRASRAGGRITADTVFRGSTQGDSIGPYVSQFLWKEVPYGAIRLVPHVRTDTAGLDYLTTWDDWLQVQNGAATPPRHAGPYRYIRTARDLAAYVQLDFSYQAFLTACLILFGMEGTTDIRRPYKGAPYDAANPYRGSKNQSGFATFGAPHALDLVARVANLALRHAWYHKWLVHRRLRPEEFGGRIHVHRTKKGTYPLHATILESVAVEQVFAQRKSYLLPQAYPEGAPMHPSYPSGHATMAGACATVLKAFFDEAFPIEEPVVPRPDGLSLEPYAGPALTVGGELDKLASNVGMGRNAAGIHWRSDNEAGLRLGEAIAIDLLREMRGCFLERFDGFSLTTFDGARITI